MLLVINALYGVALLTFAIMALFVIFHIVKYSYSKSSSFFMLLLFLPVTAAMLFFNAVLFFKIDFSEVISYLLKV